MKSVRTFSLLKQKPSGRYHFSPMAVRFHALSRRGRGAMMRGVLTGNRAAPTRAKKLSS